MTAKCPRCKSDKARLVKYLTVHAIVCDICGYDERLEFEMLPGTKTAIKERGVYRTGGGLRAQKR